LEAITNDPCPNQNTPTNTKNNNNDNKQTKQERRWGVSVCDDEFIDYKYQLKF